MSRLLGHRPAHAHSAYDMAFALDPMPPSAEAKDKLQELRRLGPLVGLNVSGLLFAGGYTRGNQFGLQSDYRQLAKRLIESILELPGHQVLLALIIDTNSSNR